MLQITFFLRNIERAHADDRLFIYCQCSLNHGLRGVPFSTRISVCKKHWKGTSVDKACPLYESINLQLNDIRAGLQKLWYSLPIHFPHETRTLSRLLFYYKNGIEKSVTPPSPHLLDAIDMMVNHKKIKNSTWKTYRTRKQNVQKFLNSLPDSHVRVEDIDHGFLDSMHHFLLNNGQSQNVANKHITMIRGVVSYCLKKKIGRVQLLGDANLTYTAPKAPKYLTADLRHKIENLNVPSLKAVRDTAMFLMYSGFSYVDYCQLKTSHIIEVDGARIWKKERQKTGIYSMPPVLVPVAKIINEYDRVENLPRIQIDDYNKLLKVLGDIVGINEQTIGFNLTSSVFRETFSSMLENEYLMSERAIMLCLGHRNARQLNTYSQVQPAKVLKEIRATGNLRMAG